MLSIFITTALAFIVGLGSYHLAQLILKERRALAGIPEDDHDLSGDLDDRHTLGYMISGLLMVIGSRLTLELVTPMGDADYYALALNGAILVFLATAIALVWVDVEAHILPSKLIYWGGGSSIALLIVAAVIKGSWEMLIPMALGGFFYFVFYGLIWFWRPGAFGFGDVRLSFFIGAILTFLSPESSVVGFVAAWILPLFAIGVGAILGTVNRKTQIAFGPWMLLGATVGLFWGRPIVFMLMP